MLRQKEVADRLRNSESQLANAQRIARLGSWKWHLKSDALRWSDEVYGITGIRPFDFSGRGADFTQLIHQDDRKQVQSAIKSALKKGDILSLNYRMGRGNKQRAIHQEGEVCRDENGTPVSVTGTIQDVTEQVQARRQIRHMARHDALTDLPNRTLFREQFAEALRDATAGDYQAGVMFVGLDRFKRVNDTLGHETGDAILKEAAKRMQQCMSRWTKKINPPKHARSMIARFGGDEFTISLPWLIGHSQAALAAEMILSAMTKPYQAGEQEIYLTSSIGVSVSPDDGDAVSGLLSNADAALRHAKAEGKNNAQFYTQSLNADARRRLALENKLQRAVANNELTVHYQPKVDLQSGTVVGMEALVRWHHPELGMVSPAEFIPIAEESGVICQIGEWVLRESCRQNVEWQNLGYPPVMVSVNLSARQFWQKNLAEQVAQALVDTQLDPRYLELEITEGTFMHNAEETIKTLTALKDLGIKLSVDDFGTGYSSLAYLQRFPIDTLKVDRSFVTASSHSADSAAITRTIIFMAHSLGMSVIAEGVETPEQLAFLREHGCNQLQGYLFSAPLTAEKFGEMLKQHRRMDIASILDQLALSDPMGTPT
jgi:diguanylate cyclase (GGDEF)-like protein/PAS domain S-box-containing protein